MFCPTQHTVAILAEWKSRFRFEWQIECIAWPIDTDRFAFQQRDVCRRFVFVNGGGGAWTESPGGPQRRLRRKGFDTLSAAARLAPEISIIAYSQTDDVPVLPRNVELRPPPDDNRLLYQDGDVCVQPSHWEGLGLPLLECQAAGMPLITTDVPPMNEHRPLAVIPAELEAAYLSSEHCIPAARIEPVQLASVLRSVVGRDISAASTEARQFVEREHSWSAARPRILAKLADLVGPAEPYQPEV
jgi:glycosyltransferase involved in cell wall biosynthesis